MQWEDYSLSFLDITHLHTDMHSYISIYRQLHALCVHLQVSINIWVVFCRLAWTNFRSLDNQLLPYKYHSRSMKTFIDVLFIVCKHSEAFYMWEIENTRKCTILHPLSSLCVYDVCECVCVYVLVPFFHFEYIYS